MDTSQCWALVAGQRRLLADAVAGLPGAAWDTPSLCAGWRVRDVVAHVLGNAEGAFTPRRALPGLLAHRLNIDAFLYDDARQRAAAGAEELTARLRAAAAGTYRPPGRTPADVLADAVIHSHDVFAPLGIDRRADPGAALTALAHSVRRKTAPHTGRRAAGLRLHATDLDWHWGQGEEVTGTGEALLMALAGRATFASRLSGPGAATLAARCPVADAAASRATSEPDQVKPPAARTPD